MEAKGIGGGVSLVGRLGISMRLCVQSNVAGTGRRTTILESVVDLLYLRRLALAALSS